MWHYPCKLTVSSLPISEPDMKYFLGFLRAHLSQVKHCFCFKILCHCPCKLCSLLILPDAGPDVKYFLGFLRTQLSQDKHYFCFKILWHCPCKPFSLLILPDAGPDVKYFLGFLRTQLSTNIILILVFGPKVSCKENRTGVQDRSSLFRLFL